MQKLTTSILPKDYANLPMILFVASCFMQLLPLNAAGGADQPAGGPPVGPLGHPDTQRELRGEQLSASLAASPPRAAAGDFDSASRTEASCRNGAVSEGPLSSGPVDQPATPPAPALRPPPDIDAAASAGPLSPGPGDQPATPPTRPVAPPPAAASATPAQALAGSAVFPSALMAAIQQRVAQHGQPGAASADARVGAQATGREVGRACVAASAREADAHTPFGLMTPVQGVMPVLRGPPLRGAPSDVSPQRRVPTALSQNAAPGRQSYASDHSSALKWPGRPGWRPKSMGASSSNIAMASQGSLSECHGAAAAAVSPDPSRYLSPLAHQALVPDHRDVSGDSSPPEASPSTSGPLARAVSVEIASPPAGQPAVAALPVRATLSQRRSLELQVLGVSSPLSQSRGALPSAGGVRGTQTFPSQVPLQNAQLGQSHPQAQASSLRAAMPQPLSPPQRGRSSSRTPRVSGAGGGSGGGGAPSSIWRQKVRPFLGSSKMFGVSIGALLVGACMYIVSELEQEEDPFAEPSGKKKKKRFKYQKILKVLGVVVGTLGAGGILAYGIFNEN